MLENIPQSDRSRLFVSLKPLIGSHNSLKSTIKVKSQESPEGAVHYVTPEEVHYTFKELLEFSNLYKPESEEQAWEWVLRVWENGDRNICLGQDEFIKMGLVINF